MSNSPNKKTIKYLTMFETPNARHQRRREAPSAAAVVTRLLTQAMTR